eukprot:scpid63699/ scgid23644/ Protocadherin Fat 3; FAT tumor suppressor homolog 3
MEKSEGRLSVLLLLTALLLPMTVSAQTIVLSPSSISVEHSGGTVFSLQLSTNIGATFSSSVVVSPPGSDTTGLFLITPSGVLRSTRALDTLAGGQSALYVLSVTATAVSSGSVVTHSYTIIVVAAKIPYFVNETSAEGYNASVHESVPIGTAVQDIVAQVPGGGVPQLRILSPTTLFSMFAQKLITAEFLDREVTDFYNLTIEAQCGNESNRTQVLITVLDSNDNAPYIVPGQIGYLYAEQPPGSLVMNITATDQDIGSNGRLNFSILTSSMPSAFSVDTLSGAVYTAMAANALPSNVSLTIGVADNGVPSFSTIDTVYIMVYNNSAPKFVYSSYRASVLENTPVPTVLLAVSAVDPDPKEAGDVVYSLSGVQAINGNPVFSIDRDSGVISLNGPLDSEVQWGYVFVVMASDRHQRWPLATTATANITVIDVNDNPPTFFATSFQRQVGEDTAVGQQIIDLGMSAWDRDTGLNAEMVFNFYQPTDPLFSINPQSGIIAVNQTLSSKKQPIHVLYLYAEDQGVPPLRGNTTVTVVVQEVNDFAPQINVASYIDIFETNGTSEGVAFLQLNITDEDGGPEGNVSASVHDGGLGLFEVKPYQRGLYYTRSLDYESSPVRSWVITLTAADAGTPSKNSSKNVTVNLLDWNEYAPVFNSTEYIGCVNLTSNTSAGTGHLQVFATDADGRYNTVRYAIIDGQNNTEFIIDAVTGVISYGGVDINVTKNFTLTVSATDNGVPFERNNTVIVTMRVLPRVITVPDLQYPPEAHALQAVV